MIKTSPSNAGGVDLIPVWGAKILCALRYRHPTPPTPEKKERKEKVFGRIFPGGSVLKNLLAKAGDAREVGLIPEKIP